MLMQDLRSQLRKAGYFVTPAGIRGAEERGIIPEADRDWRGWRTFDERHLDGLKDWLANRRQPQHAA